MFNHFHSSNVQNPVVPPLVHNEIPREWIVITPIYEGCKVHELIINQPPFIKDLPTFWTNKSQTVAIGGVGISTTSWDGSPGVFQTPRVLFANSERLEIAVPSYGLPPEIMGKLFLLGAIETQSGFCCPMDGAIFGRLIEFSCQALKARHHWEVWVIF